MRVAKLSSIGPQTCKESLPLVNSAFPGQYVEFTSVAFSPDGKQIITGTNSRNAYVWDCHTGAQVAVLPVLAGSKLFVWSASYSPNGRWIVTAADDGIARFWDAQSGYAIAKVNADERALYTAVFDADGSRLVTVGNEGMARVWDVSLLSLSGSALRDRVCSEKLIGAQSFTDEEIADPILWQVDRNDSVARNLCLRSGPLAPSYWSRQLEAFWRMLLGNHLNASKP